MLHSPNEQHCNKRGLKASIKAEILFMCNWTETWSCTIIYLVLVYKQKKRQNIKGQFIFSFLSISPKFFGSWMWGLYKILPRNFKPQHKQLRVDVGVVISFLYDITIKSIFPELCGKDKWQTFHISGCFSWQTRQAQYCLKRSQPRTFTGRVEEEEGTQRQRASALHQQVKACGVPS